MAGRRHDEAEEEVALEPLRCNAIRKRSVNDFGDFDPSSEIDSPRSLRACAAEGIRPKDLTFVPPEAFERPEVPDEVARLRAEFFESFRQDLLALTRRGYEAALKKESPAHPLAPCPDPTSQYRNTVAFFRRTLQALDLGAIPVVADWATCPRSPEFKRSGRLGGSQGGQAGAPTSPGATSLGFNAALNAANAASDLGCTLSVAELLEQEQRPDSALALTDGFSAMSQPWSPLSGTTGGGAGRSMAGSGCGGTTTRASWRSATSKDNLKDSLGQIRAAPGSDWKEHDMARRMEDSFGSTREIEVKALRRRHDDENKLLKKRLGMIEKSFQGLRFEEQRKDRLREIREFMMPPVGKPAGGSDGRIRARDKIIQMTEEAEYKRREQFEQRIVNQQNLEQQLDDNLFSTKVKFAQMTLEDRVRWRHNYAVVTDNMAADTAGVLEDFRRKQAQLDNAGKKAADTNAIKREVMNLRRTHRLLDEYRRRRKDEYIDNMRKAQLRDLGERRIDETGGRFDSPMGAFAHQFLSKTALSSFGLSSALSASSPDLRGGSLPASPSAGAAGLGASGRFSASDDDDEDEPISSQDLNWMQSVKLSSRRSRHRRTAAKQTVSSLLTRSASSPGFLPPAAAPSSPSARALAAPSSPSGAARPVPVALAAAC